MFNGVARDPIAANIMSDLATNMCDYFKAGSFLQKACACQEGAILCDRNSTLDEKLEKIKKTRKATEFAPAGDDDDLVRGCLPDGFALMRCQLQAHQPFDPPQGGFELDGWQGMLATNQVA